MRHQLDEAMRIYMHYEANHHCKRILGHYYSYRT